MIVRRKLFSPFVLRLIQLGNLQARRTKKSEILNEGISLFPVRQTDLLIKGADEVLNRTN